MNIIDAHHHIWPQADLPWLNGPMQPRIFGPYESIMRDYPLEEFQRDISGSGVSQSVYVQANWAVNRYEDEVAWVQKQAYEHGTVAGIVGFADFTVGDVRPQLDRLARYPLMRGVRQQLHWHENPLYRFAAQPDLARNEVLQRNVAHLKDYQWTFDLQVFADQMPGACELAEAVPDVTFILQHAGMLEGSSQDLRRRWQDAMKQLAKAPNVVSKLSAFGTFIHRNDPEHIQWMIENTVRIFGAKRCLFGSNFPIEKIWTDYSSLLTAFIEGCGALDANARTAIFHDTARRVYRL